MHLKFHIKTRPKAGYHRGSLVEDRIRAGKVESRAGQSSAVRCSAVHGRVGEVSGVNGKGEGAG